MTTLAVSVAVAALSLATDDAPETELDKYQGTWVLVSEEFEGKKVPTAELADDLKNLSDTVRGDKLFFALKGKVLSATIKLDPSKSPKAYDLVRDDDGRFLKGIYTWDGFKTIKVCSADNQGDRPKEFKTEAGSRNRIRVWRRQP
jgi:uncharacterized protein (TIGR03067 family)